MIEATALAIPTPALTALVSSLGESAVSTGLSDRLANARGVWPVELKAIRAALTGSPHTRHSERSEESLSDSGHQLILPSCVVWPNTTEHVSAVLRIAQEWRIPVIPFGGGSGIVGGTTAVPGCISLDTKRLDRLQLDAVSLVAHAQAGIFGVDLERQLNDQGCSLGHFPQSLHSSTVGGWVATRASGTFSTLHGNIENRVVGLEVVLPGGEVLRTRATPRSATGPKLAELFLGSEGTLGVVTEAALWVHPLPEHRVWTSSHFPSFEAGLTAICEMLHGGIRPAVVRLYDAGETEHKFGAMNLPSDSCLLILIYEGPRDLAVSQSILGADACAAAGGSDRGREPADQWWRTRFDTSGLVRANSRSGGVADAIEVAAFWRELPSVYAAMMEAAERHGAHAYAHVSHAYPSGAGLYVIFSAGASDDEEAVALYRRIVDDLLAACVEAGGSISHHHGVGRGKAGWMTAEWGEAGIAMLRAIKRSVDPYGIMNPGALGLGG